MTTQLRPHKVLTHKEDKDVNALVWLEGKYGGIVFKYNSVSFEEDLENDKLKLKFDYDVLDIPERVKIDKDEFEKELGDFLVQLLYYGLERDYLSLGYIDDNNPPNDSIKFD